ncbi:MAG: alpha/beta hydrolase, partial [Bacteroidales bacterium]|nr:alpha/beta hydrolase [Bacteroidales bacterium]
LIEIKAPVLFIAGKQDPVIAIDKVMAQAHLPDHSELLILGNTAHMAFLEARKESLDMLESFADRCFGY